MARKKKIYLGTRKNSYVNKRRKGLRARLYPWFRRFGLALAVITAIIWAGAWFFLSDADAKTAHWINDKIVLAAASAGFKVNNVLIEGRRHTDFDLLTASLNVEQGDPLFGFDPDEAKKTIQEFVWIENIHIQRRLPDTLYVRLEERQPLALWQKDKKLHLIDHNGEIIAARDLQPFKNLVIMTGEDAPLYANELFRILIGEPEIYKRIETASFVAHRRWNITLKNDIRIKMPEHDIAFALSRIARAQEDDKILDKDLSAIDLRDPERMIVRTKPGRTSEYHSNYKSGYRKASSDGNNI